jgi:hypothetical protein
MDKRAWDRPQLIELVRGRPEEAILTSCKDGGQGVSPHGYWNNCNESAATGPACGLSGSTASINAYSCVACSTISAS